MFVPWAVASPRAPRHSRGGTAASALLMASLCLTACERGDDYPQTTFRPVSAFGDALNAVFYNTFWWTMAILVIVVALILWAAFRFRERPGAPMPAQIHGNTKLELGWTIVPSLIVVLISVPTVRTIFETQRRPPEDALVIEVIGHQWWWEFRYPQYQLNTANLMYVPTGRPISLVMNSADVIHSFWVPKIGGKRDVNPLPRRREGVETAHANYLTFTVREPGHYLGQCAEFCGESHGLMRMSAMAVEPAEFDSWVRRMRGPQTAAAPAPQPAPDTTAGAPAQPVAMDTAAAAQQRAGTAGGATVAGAQQAARAGLPQPPVAAPPAPTPPAQLQIGQMPVPTGAGNPFRAPLPDTLMQVEGKRIFEGAACVACHAVAGTPAVGTLGPNLTLFGTRPYIAAGAVENSRDDLIRWIKDPQAVKPGALMPGTTRGAAGVAPTGLTDAEVRAVAAYLAGLK